MKPPLHLYQNQTKKQKKLQAKNFVELPCPRDTKGTFHANMGIIKERNGRDLTEAEDNKKR